jgi:hypothetical protein
MESGFGSWMGGDDDLSELEDAIEEEMMEGLELEEAIAIGGLFGAVLEEEEAQQDLETDFDECFDDLDDTLRGDKEWAPLYYDDPEFARLVYKSVQEAMEKADKRVAMKRRAMENE